MEVVGLKPPELTEEVTLSKTHQPLVASKRRSRWDETPAAATPGGMTPSSMTPNMTPGGTTPGGMTPTGMTPTGMTPSGMTPNMTPGGMTPGGTTPTGQKAMAMATPTPGHLMSMTPEQLQAFTWQRELDERNRPLSDEELDAMFPVGYKVDISLYSIFVFFGINSINKTLFYHKFSYPAKKSFILLASFLAIIS